MSVHCALSWVGAKSHHAHGPFELLATATRKTFPPPDATYCRSQIQIPRPGSCNATWSKQTPPAAEGNVVNGSTWVQALPDVPERLANQFPVKETWRPAAATVGSPTLEVWVDV